MESIRADQYLNCLLIIFTNLDIDAVQLRRKILLCQDVDFLRKMKNLNKTYFEFNNNSFIHRNSNKITVHNLELMKVKEIKEFWTNLNSFMKFLKRLKFLPIDLIYNNFKKEFSKLFDINVRTFSFIKCVECKKLIKKGCEFTHLQKCNQAICKFCHIDGVYCNYKIHSKNLHANFISANSNVSFPKLVYNKNMSTNSCPQEKNEMNNIDLILNDLKNKNIIIKSQYVQAVTKKIIDNYSNKFRIIAKHCKCLKSFKRFCNCFLSILNNCDTISYLSRPKKNLHYAMKDFESKGFNLICIILINYSENELKSKENINFFANIRQCKNIKFVFLVHDDFNYHLIQQSIFKKFNIACNQFNTLC